MGPALRQEKAMDIRVRTVFVGLCAVVVSGAACDSELQDRFECGVRATTGDVASQCDRGNEVCICSDHRCAPSVDV